MGVHALACTKCGGPLAADSFRAGMTTCPFCHFVIVVDAPPNGVAAYSSEATALKAMASSEQERKALADDLAAATAAGRELFPVLRDGLANHLKRTDAAPIARATFAIVDDFARENAIDAARRDPVVVARVAEAVIKATYVLAGAPAADLNLPFLAADGTGPKHLERTLAESDFAVLAKREPAPTIVAAPPPAEPAPPPPKKKGWFGFWAVSLVRAIGSTC